MSLLRYRDLYDVLVGQIAPLRSVSSSSCASGRAQLVKSGVYNYGAPDMQTAYNHNAGTRDVLGSVRVAERRRERSCGMSWVHRTYSSVSQAPTDRSGPPSSSVTSSERSSVTSDPSYSSSMTLSMTRAAVDKIKELQAKRGDPGIGLRLSVSGGGCSGFQYEFVIEPGGGERIQEKNDADADADADADTVLEVDGARLVCDPVSMEFVKGSTIDYENDMIQSKFVVQENPNAELGCGCGSSFSVAGL